MNFTAKNVVRYMLLSGVAGVPFTAVLAQSQKQAETPEIVVTGSAIKTTPDAVAVPVTTIKASDMQKAGVNSNVLDILRKSVPSFGGRSNQGASNGSNNNQRTGGGCSIQLRNLDTLVLVNGRRVAIDSIIGASNGKPFVNICEIAPDSIDHIEVLTDGASAIYGSDAIGGVVNIILKSDYQGAQINARYGGASGYNERSVGGTFGFNPVKYTNITIGASWSKTDPLFQSQRGFASPFYSTNYGVPGAIGNYFLTPGVTTPALGGGYANAAADPQYINAGASVGTAINTGVIGTHDISSYDTMLMGEQQKSITMSLNSDLSGGARSVVLFGDFEYAKNDSFASYAPSVVGLSVPASSPVNPFTSAVTVNFGDSQTPVTYNNSEQSYRGTLGLKGKFAALGHNMDWEIGYTHSENALDELISNILYRPNVATSAASAGGYNAACSATAGGTYSRVLSAADGTSFVCQPVINPFGVGSALNQASLANVLTSETFHGKSKLDAFDAKLSGTLFNLPGGRVGFAIGGQWRREAISTALSPDAWLHQGGNPANGLLGVNHSTGGIGVGVYNALTNPGGGDVGGLLFGQNGTALTGDPFSASRTITAQFMELRLPLVGADTHIPGFYNFDLVGAVRHEHYSDAGDSTVPKIGFRWQPIARQITIRGNYARSFTAPTLYQLFQPINFRTVGTGPVNSALLGFSAPGSVAGFFGEDGNNPNAKPAHSESWALGAVLKPDAIPHLSIDVEYSKAKETGQITGINYNNILADVNLNGAASQFYNNVAVGSYANLGSSTKFATPGSLAAYLKGATVANGGIDANTGNYNLYVVDRPTNLGLINVESLNVTTNYVIPTSHMGTITLTNQLAYLINFQNEYIPGNSVSNPITLVYNYAGTTTQGSGAQGTLPRLSMYTSLDWDWNQWDFGIADTYIGPVADIGAGGAGFYGSASVPAPAGSGYLANQAGFVIGHVASFSSWDLRVGWRSNKEKGGKGLTVNAGINNLFNTQPPVSTNISPTAGAVNGSTAWRLENNTDAGTYLAGVIGRMIWISAGFKF
ncbi:MAG: TonB-dependent receptor [Alphaproteobacteria bacterium]|nr:TonB-dependent receptor [Alphaproteobacteria bacterium]